jgi:hypothetical protein
MKNPNVDKCCNKPGGFHEIDCSVGGDDAKKAERRKGRRFPILLDHIQRKLNRDLPTQVPWEMLEPFEDNAKRNHDQSLEVLASRGGLGPTEIIAIIEGRGFSWIMAQPKDEVECWKKVVEYIRQHEGIVATEIEFLRWFYEYAPLVGMPAVTLQETKRKFEEATKKVLPKGYEIKEQ